MDTATENNEKKIICYNYRTTFISASFLCS